MSEKFFDVYLNISFDKLMVSVFNKFDGKIIFFKEYNCLTNFNKNHLNFSNLEKILQNSIREIEKATNSFLNEIYLMIDTEESMPIYLSLIKERDTYTIHGLWPQYINTGYPSSCTTELFDTTIPEQIGESTMIQYWPDVQYTTDDPQYDSFWIHEWSKHGTCSGLTQLQYFNEAIQLTQRIPTPSILSESVGNNISASILRDSMGGNNYVSLQCNNQVLTGAYTCWNQTDGIPTTQIVCPLSVVKEDTCILSNDIQVVELD